MVAGKVAATEARKRPKSKARRRSQDRNLPGAADPLTPFRLRQPLFQFLDSLLETLVARARHGGDAAHHAPIFCALLARPDLPVHESTLAALPHATMRGR